MASYHSGKLREYLENPLSIDYWSDVGIDEALKIVTHFDLDDWAAVETE